jgi:hypothetical protein
MNCLLLSFLITNAIFWGLFPHTSHCQIIQEINHMLGTNITCPKHIYHICLGIFFYLLSIYLTQKDSKDLKL